MTQPNTYSPKGAIFGLYSAGYIHVIVHRYESPTFISVSRPFEAKSTRSPFRRWSIRRIFTREARFQGGSQTGVRFIRIPPPPPPRRFHGESETRYDPPTAGARNKLADILGFVPRTNLPPDYLRPPSLHDRSPPSQESIYYIRLPLSPREPAFSGSNGETSTDVISAPASRRSTNIP